MASNKLTNRQKEVLRYVRAARVVRSGSDGAALRSLASKGLVCAHPFSEGQNTYYTWSLTELGKTVVIA